MLPTPVSVSNNSNTSNQQVQRTAHREHLPARYVKKMNDKRFLLLSRAFCVLHTIEARLDSLKTLEQEENIKSLCEELKPLCERVLSMGKGLKDACKNRFFYRLGSTLQKHLPKTAPLKDFIIQAFRAVKWSNRDPKDLKRLLPQSAEIAVLELELEYGPCVGDKRQRPPEKEIGTEEKEEMESDIISRKRFHGEKNLQTTTSPTRSFAQMEILAAVAAACVASSGYQGQNPIERKDAGAKRQRGGPVLCFSPTGAAVAVSATLTDQPKVGAMEVEVMQNSPEIR